MLAPPIGAILGWVIHAVVVKGKTERRGDLEQVRREVGDAMGST